MTFIASYTFPLWQLISIKMFDQSSPLELKLPEAATGVLFTDVYLAPSAVSSTQQVINQLLNKIKVAYSVLAYMLPL